MTDPKPDLATDPVPPDDLTTVPPPDTGPEPEPTELDTETVTGPPPTQEDPQ